MAFDYHQFTRARIEELRKNRGVSKRILSESIGKSNTYLTDIMRNETLPSMRDFFELCEQLNITPEHFFSASDEDYQAFFKLYCSLKDIMTLEDIRTFIDATSKMGKKDYDTIRRFLIAIAESCANGK